MSTEDEVRAASAQFYAALTSMANGDAGPMGDIWSTTDEATTMHPIGGREEGWEEVRGSWEGVASLASEGQVELTEQLIRSGEDMAYEEGIERGHAVIAGDRVNIEHRVTNIYRREGGAWKIVHHHTDLSPDMLAVLERLQSEE